MITFPHETKLVNNSKVCDFIKECFLGGSEEVREGVGKII